jgi:hypothetical protein
MVSDLFSRGLIPLLRSTRMNIRLFLGRLEPSSIGGMANLRPASDVR